MNKLEKIAYNCKKATLLIEKKQLGTLSLQDQFELKYHLAGCSVCRLFQQQSAEINRRVKALLPTIPYQGLRMDEEAKKDLQLRIDEQFRK